MPVTRADAERWLRADLGHDDVTNDLPGESTARLVAKGCGVVAGVDAAERVFDVEVETVAEAERAAGAGADVVLVDNATPETVRETRERLEPSVLVEASGGIGVADVPAYAAAGADVISMGAHALRAAARLLPSYSRRSVPVISSGVGTSQCSSKVGATSRSEPPSRTSRPPSSPSGAR
ncbi:nicotinate-nucleotide pyrophosphorylase [Halarchaeum solikamskense]|nr:nicotinate-nucleotide pyrophosphorylase [Halarchaeum solikamskense]